MFILLEKQYKKKRDTKKNMNENVDKRKVDNLTQYYNGEDILFSDIFLFYLKRVKLYTDIDKFAMPKDLACNNICRLDSK